MEMTLTQVIRCHVQTVVKSLLCQPEVLASFQHTSWYNNFWISVKLESICPKTHHGQGIKVLNWSSLVSCAQAMSEQLPTVCSVSRTHVNRVQSVIREFELQEIIKSLL